MIARPTATTIRAGVLLAAQALAAATGAAATVALIAVMGAEAFGTAVAVISAATLVSLMASGNLEALAMQQFTQGSDAARLAYLSLSRQVIWCATGVFALALLVATLIVPADRLMTLPGILALVPVLAILRAQARHCAALGSPLFGTLPRLLSRPVGFGLLVCATFATTLSIAWWHMVVTLFVASLAGIGVQRLSLGRSTIQLQLRAEASLAETGQAEAPARRSLLLRAAQLAPMLLYLEYFRDLVILGSLWSLTSAETGVLSLALTLAALPGLAVLAVDVATGAPIARAVADEQPVLIRKLLSQATMLRLAGIGPGLVVLGAALMVISSTQNLGDIAAASWILATVPLQRALLGNAHQILMLFGQTRRVFGITALGLLLGVPAVHIGGAVAGVSGVACAAASLHLIVSVALWSACRRHTGLDASALGWCLHHREAREQRRRASCPAPTASRGDHAGAAKA